MRKTVSPNEVRAYLLAKHEVALLDLREEAPYALAHPLFAANLPLSRLEMEILDRVPRKSAPIVLYDDGEGLVAPAITRLEAIGYTQVCELAGGLSGWRRAGLELFQDVNSASKAFGELVDSRRHTPSVSASDLQGLIAGGANLVVLDARRFEEYSTMSIPNGVSVPGAELVLRARALAPDPATTIVVNCAGRTRSIIGAQSLINAGLPNPIAALRNGTIGWMLAGQALEHGRRRRFGEPDPAQEAQARRAARAVADRAGVGHVGVDDLDELMRAQNRTLYRFDVRTPEEFAQGHIAGFRSAPGGQLVQETDAFAPVRGAVIALWDDRGVRADMTASWLVQMGWDVYVLDGDFAPTKTGPWQASIPPPPLAPVITPDALAAVLARVTVIDLAPSPVFACGHIPGAVFAIRAQLGNLTISSPVVLTSPDSILACFAAAELAALTPHSVTVLEGGTARWAREGHTLALGPAMVAQDVYRRPYEGTDNPGSAMQAYLDWEYGLVAQLARDASHGFFVL